MVTKFYIDTNKSSINWIGKKVTGQHNGTINIQSGYIAEEDGNIQSGEIVIDAKSIVVLDVKDKPTNDQFAGHLASDDFFASNKFPLITYRILSATKLEGNKHKVFGNLIIKGISQAQSFDALIALMPNSLDAKGEIIIDRTKFDIRFRSGNFFQNLGDTLIYDDFTLDVKIEARPSPVNP